MLIRAKMRILLSKGKASSSLSNNFCIQIKMGIRRIQKRIVHLTNLRFWRCCLALYRFLSEVISAGRVCSISVF